MTNKIKLKRSNTGGSAPTTANLEVGEVAINMPDRLLYYRDPANNIKTMNIADLNDFDTGNLAEGSNLYYTDGRVNTYLTTNNYATQSYVDTEISNLIDTAPATLDTLNELAAALGDDPNFATTVTNSIATKLAISDFSSYFNTDFAAKDTDGLSEGLSNLYYTDARARNAISVSGDLAYNSTTGVISYSESVQSVNGATGVVVLDTDDVNEGTTNFYYTDARFDARLSLKDTGDLTEGSNLYYTDGRVDTHLNTGTAATGEFLSWNGSDYDWVAGGGGGATILDDLSDVTISAVADNQLIAYDSGTSQFVNTSSIETAGITNTATSFAESLVAKRNSGGGAITAARYGQGALADGHQTGIIQVSVEGTSSTAYPGSFAGIYDSTFGNRLKLTIYDDGVSTFTNQVGLNIGGDDAEFFDGDLTLSTDGTNQVIGSTTGNITLSPAGSEIAVNKALTITSDGSTSDPYISLTNTQNTPGNYNSAATINWYAKSSANNYRQIGVTDNYFTDHTDGSEDSEIAFRVIDNGSSMTPMVLNADAVIVTGGAENFFRNQNNGNAADIKLNNTNGSIANNDVLGQLAFQSGFSTHAQIESRITDTTGGSQDTNFEFYIKRNGSLQQYLNIGDSDRITPKANVDIEDGWLQIKNGSSIPTQYFYRNQNHGSGQFVGQTQYFGQDSFGGAQEYGAIQVIADDATSGSEQGSIEFQVADNGTITTVASVDRSGIELIGYRETANPPGSSGTIAPDPSGGTYGVITLGGNITFNGFTNPIAGQSYTLVIKQPSSGGPYTLTSTMLFSGGGKTLSTTPNAVDVMTVFYDGTSYYASLTLGYA